MFRKRPDGRAALIVASLLLLFVGRTMAQSPPSLYQVYASPTVAEALGDEYGQAIIAELARLMTKRAEAECLRTRGLSQDALKQRAGDILSRYGAKVMALVFPPLDEAKIEAELAKLAGPGAADELRSLAAHPGVQKVRALSVPIRNDEVVDQIATAFDRHLILQRLVLDADLNPIGSGQQDLILLQENRGVPFTEYTDSVEEEAWFKRFLELTLHLREAEARVMQAAGMTDVQTHRAFAGVEDDLRNACVRLGPPRGP